VGALSPSLVTQQNDFVQSSFKQAMFEYGCLDVCMWTGNVIDLDQLASLLIALHFFIISFGYNRHSDPITDALIY
jgi:hypothetical protein